MLFFTGWTRGRSVLLAVFAAAVLVIGLAGGASLSTAISLTVAAVFGFVVLERVTWGVQSDPRMHRDYRPPSDDETAHK